MKYPMTSKTQLHAQGIAVYNTKELCDLAKDNCRGLGRFLRAEIRFKKGEPWLVAIYASSDDQQQCEVNIAI